MHSHRALSRGPTGLYLRSHRLSVPPRAVRAGAITSYLTRSDTAQSCGYPSSQHSITFDPEAWARNLLPWPSSSQTRWTTTNFRSMSSTCYIIIETTSHRVLSLGDGMHLLAFPSEADAATLLEHLEERGSHDGAFVEARPAASLSGSVSRLSRAHAVCRDDLQDLCWWAMRRDRMVCIVDRVTYADTHVQIVGRPARDTGLVALRARPILSGRLHTDGYRASKTSPLDG